MLLSHGTECNMGDIFLVSRILRNVLLLLIVSRISRICEPLGQWNVRNEEIICQYCARQRAITTLSLNDCWNVLRVILPYDLTY